MTFDVLTRCLFAALFLVMGGLGLGWTLWFPVERKLDGEFVGFVIVGSLWLLVCFIVAITVYVYA